MGGGKILFIRYIEKFDTKQETPFWYIIKDGPFVFDELDAKYRRSVRKSLERCEVKLINPLEYSEALWKVNEAAYSKYHNADNKQTREEFYLELKNTSCDCWAAFGKDDGQLVGWILCMNYEDYAETKKAKYHPDYQDYRPSDALHYVILDYYLNNLGKKYVLSGARNLNHKTNVQEYEIKNWKYRRAYCYLIVKYRNSIKWIIRTLYPFRRPLLLLDKISVVHLVNSMLLQEKIARDCDKLKGDNP